MPTTSKECVLDNLCNVALTDIELDGILEDVYLVVQLNVFTFRLEEL